MTAAAYAELAAASHFSFLRGASHPSEMVAQAMALGLAGIGIADRNSVAGVVRAHVSLERPRQQARDAMSAMKKAEGRDPILTEAERLECDGMFRLVVGARLVFVDGTPDIIAYPRNRHGWGRLTRLLTTGNLRAEKGDCILEFADLLAYLQDLLLIVLPASTAEPQRPRRKTVDYDGIAPPAAEAEKRLVLVPPTVPPSWEGILRRLVREAPGRVWLGATMLRQGSDRRRLARLMRIGAAAGVPLIALNEAFYAGPDQRPLHDVLSCVRVGTTIVDAGRRLEANAERHLKPPDEMLRLFADCRQAVTETIDFLDRIEFSLDQLAYEYPHEPVPPRYTPIGWLARLTVREARKRYGSRTIPEKVRRNLLDELAFIHEHKFAFYFLTVHDIVAFARAQEPPILCQGRGSAANSTVCFLLGVTSVDPLHNDLLFSRFISADRGEPPDIDVDFEHERREEVMQYIYRRYGRHRAAIASTVIHYRPRSAVRDVGKALGLSEDVITRISSTVWGSFSSELEEKRVTEAGFDLHNPEIARVQAIVGQLLATPFPRHLSQHVGGFVLTQDRLDETVPLHNAAMDDRSFIEWDKDDIDDLKLMKVDVLALGMLTCIRKAFDLMRDNGLGDHTLEVDLMSEDDNVYAMLRKGDSIGVFQVESRAQINMLPRLRPKEFYDLVIQVAIVRPGPIQGDMVHPYLRRRNKQEEADLPSPGPGYNQNELKEILGKTLGVPLFQEQAMNLAITAAEFTPAEANQLRRAMATFRNVGNMDDFREKLVGGMVRRGYERDFAERCYRQIEGFGSYGFPESHALSFARLVYVSSWIKHYHPAVFTCALLNSQPMGFYAPAQLVRDAREHDVEVRPIDVSYSLWDNSLERCDDGRLALRIGFRQVDGFREEWATSIADARAAGPFVSIEDVARRAGLPERGLRLIADADACRSLGADRRTALWEVRRTPSTQLPLFGAADAHELGEEPDAHLPEMPLSEQVAADYQMTRLSLKQHPMHFLRDLFRGEGVLSCQQTSDTKDGRRVRTAGIVLVRQRPGEGNAIFVTLEDETGITNALIWARLFERYRRPIMASRLMLIEGQVQRSAEGVVHLMATRIVDRTTELDRLSETEDPRPQLLRADEVLHPQYPRGPMHRHPRDVRLLPKSRDFH
ncbi:error-prone DNA polymerase [Sphingomonas zeicaulis]|uniref:error-prone DNA polymerase n=1 Tax=Sphingomonas zeicaulis TaxID=1632740 RepID=UPI003D2491C7